jgi:hypothetical protein
MEFDVTAGPDLDRTGDGSASMRADAANRFCKR